MFDTNGKRAIISASYRATHVNHPMGCLQANIGFAHFHRHVTSTRPGLSGAPSSELEQRSRAHWDNREALCILLSLSPLTSAQVARLSAHTSFTSGVGSSLPSDSSVHRGRSEDVGNNSTRELALQHIEPGRVALRLKIAITASYGVSEAFRLQEA